MLDGYSFVIPAYNDAEGLKQHFSYFAEVHDRVQLVVVDDCSTDDTQEVVEAVHLPENIRLTYHRIEQNAGPGPARNLGLSLAEEERVMFLDADDLLAPCFFDVMRLAPLSGEVDFVMFKYHLSRETGLRFTYDMHLVDRRFFSSVPAHNFPVQQFRLQDIPEVLATVNFPWNKVYRRDFLLEREVSFPDLRMHEDITPHWQSFLECRAFGIMGWAPPLITHFEVPAAGRATNYIGEKRMGVFAELSAIEGKILSHSQASRLLPVFSNFCGSFFDWLTEGLCREGGDESLFWKERYQNAVEKFWEASCVAAPVIDHDGGGVPLK